MTPDELDVTPEPAREGPADLLSALARLGEALEDSQPRLRQAVEKSELLATRRGDGRSWSDVVLSEDPPALSALLSNTLRALNEANSLYRRALAQALYSDGLSMQRVAHLFGVSRQRISHILRPDGAGSSPAAGG
jgi:hypothetical protein